MMTIKEGFGSKATHIKIYPRERGDRMAEVWIDQEGIASETSRTETLAYITLEELLDLRDEINKVIKQIVGVA